MSVGTCIIALSCQVIDQKSMKLIRELEEQTPIDVGIGQAISRLWEGEREMTVSFHTLDIS